MESRSKRTETISLSFTKEELDEIRLARKKPIVFDKDCPETTPERALRFRRVNRPKEVVGK